MEQKIDRRKLAFMAAAAAAVPAFALIAAPAGIAQDASPEASPEGSPEATPGAGGDEVEIGSYDIYFDPSEVTIPADTDVTILLPNHGVTLHSFVINDKNNDDLPFDPINIDIAAGEEEETTINAPAGKYYFFCDIPGHEAAGMHGILTAE